MPPVLNPPLPAPPLGPLRSAQDNKQCSQPWLLSGNYCRATCGRCKLAGQQNSGDGSKDKEGGSDGSSSSSDDGQSDSSSSSSSSSFSSSSSSSSSSSGACSDVTPPGEAGCQQQKEWGKCGDAYMQKGNYCARSCGRCGQQGQKVQAYAEAKGGGG